MDLHQIGAPPTAEERAAVDALLGPPASGWDGGSRGLLDGHVARGGHGARGRRHLLLPALHAVQGRVGWISRGALDYVSQRLTVPPAEAYGVASFYALFALEPQPPSVVHVCDDIACRAGGAIELCAELDRRVGPAGTPVAGGAATWQRSPCLGQCEHGTAALVVRAGDPPVERCLAPALADEISAVLAGVVGGGPITAPTPYAAPASAASSPPASSVPFRAAPTSAASPLRIPQRGQPGLRLLRRVGRVDPSSLEDYRAVGGYLALRRAVHLGPEGVIREVTDAKLLGRGGAAFPTGRKWDAVARQPARPHYVVCNADESEPGTFKDRVLLEHDPFAVLEAMTIAGFATGCEQGYLYIRGEYPAGAATLQEAIDEARRRGVLGEDVLGEGFRFDVELRRGAGAYICGEETALFNSIEGYRGEPRNKPPFPVTAGLFAKPTVINNVETLVNVLEILEHGAAAYAATGTPESTGTRLFCLSGRVAEPGLYELPFGVTLGALLELAGGVRDGRPLRAVLLGGAAGSFVGPDQLDLPLSFEATRAAGVTLGSGVVLVLDDTVDLGGILARIAQFFRDESCGQCVPCRVGTVRQEELVDRLMSGRPLGDPGEEQSLFDEIAQVMRDASICGLGQTAASAIGSALVGFPELLARGNGSAGTTVQGREAGKAAAHPSPNGSDR